MPRDRLSAIREATAAKVRHPVSSAGLRLIEFSTEEEERAVVHRSFLRFFALGSARGPESPSGRRRRRIERFPGTLFFHGGC